MHWSFYLSLFVAVLFAIDTTLKACLKKGRITGSNIILLAASIVWCVYSILEL